MGIFSNFKKDKPDDDFVASDDWLLGLAEDDPASIEALAAGPNGHRHVAGLVDDSTDPVIDREAGETDSGSTWHFPDLDDASLPGLDLPDEADAGADDDSIPTGPEAAVLLEILGLAPGSSWRQISAAHAAAVAEYDSSNETDPDRAALADALRREMNTSYAALRLMAVS